MARPSRQSRLFVEKPIAGDGPSAAGRGRAADSVTINPAESPLGWLFARSHVTRRQFDAGQRLRIDWERGQLGSAGYHGIGLRPGFTQPWRGCRSERPQLLPTRSQAKV